MCRSREQVVCAGGKAGTPSDGESVSNAGVEHADDSVKHVRLVCVGVELGGCERYARASKH